MNCALLFGRPDLRRLKFVFINHLHQEKQQLATVSKIRELCAVLPPVGVLRRESGWVLRRGAAWMFPASPEGNLGSLPVVGS